jgi:hypothetical protein
MNRTKDNRQTQEKETVHLWMNNYRPFPVNSEKKISLVETYLNRIDRKPG